mmetsp:Transcript_24838/g.35404  ORF Transcript_24838/g.35404 Transcript_24838/m.35404 type:complete len:196 (-) Transcript_24838:35-622(-)
MTQLSPSRPPPSQRRRLNSKDIPRTYSGLYGDGNDLLPFELSRNRNTEWLQSAPLQLLGTYIGIIFVFHMLFLGFLEWNFAWTVTHVAHFVVTMVYIHWIKGSPNFYEQGEMNGMTLWEQIESTSGTTNAKRALLVVPTLLCYAACHFMKYDPEYSFLNVFIWCVCIFPKLPFMNGVRILGINRTTGIDDDFKTK